MIELVFARVSRLAQQRTRFVNLAINFILIFGMITLFSRAYTYLSSAHFVRTLQSASEKTDLFTFTNVTENQGAGKVIRKAGGIVRECLFL